MIELRPSSLHQIERFFPDFAKKARHFEVPPEGSEVLGIYEDGVLVGYFIVRGYPDKDLEVNQGYLSQEARHRNLSSLAMQLLEQRAKRAGFKRIILAGSRSLKAYTKFMANMGYKPERIIFSKEVI